MKYQNIHDEPVECVNLSRARRIHKALHCIQEATSSRQKKEDTLEVNVTNLTRRLERI